ncbi:MAG: hypothetical protein HXX15_06605 [Rhodopseudomonas sp.]|uniref:hypothetical protein n=1 Tax=Rhodopseudomonas sp. TaxID=1078 RepID=UPI0018138F02|nr:hypothetical protein [Rhodopseudomonas sp.]NVN85744.1 hypothetical protein [Rhodopseudomonas sp.]
MPLPSFRIRRKLLFASLTTALVVSVASALSFVEPALGEDGVLQLAGSGSFREMLLDGPPASWRGGVVGASIVGLRYQSQATEFNPKSVRVLLGSAQGAKDFLCVRYISRDGRYSAEARYKLVPGAGGEPVLETKTAYEKLLTAYKSSDIAISARSATSCDNLKDGTLFAIDVGGSRQRQLVVLMNGGNARIRAQLGQNSKALTQPVLCELVADQVRVGFTQECRIDLPPDILAGAYQLSIGETASTGEIAVKTHPLMLYGVVGSTK